MARIAIAAVNGVNYLLTWNFKHIANATLRPRIEEVCRDAGFASMRVRTPEHASRAFSNGQSTALAGWLVTFADSMFHAIQ